MAWRRIDGAPLSSRPTRPSEKLHAIMGLYVSPPMHAVLSRRRLKRGVFRSVVDLQAAINHFVTEHSEAPRPFIWRADPDAIIAARTRGFQALESFH